MLSLSLSHIHFGYQKFQLNGKSAFFSVEMWNTQSRGDKWSNVLKKHFRLCDKLRTRHTRGNEEVLFINRVSQVSSAEFLGKSR